MKKSHPYLMFQTREGWGQTQKEDESLQAKETEIYQPTVCLSEEHLGGIRVIPHLWQNECKKPLTKFKKRKKKKKRKEEKKKPSEWPSPQLFYVQ